MAEHGGALDRAMAEFGGAADDWLDLSTGINPVPYPVGDINPAAWHRLPDEAAMKRCLDVARDYYNVPDGAEIVAAPGTQALIQLLPHLMRSHRVAIVGPTYNEYANAYAFHGADPVDVRTLPAISDGFGSVVIGNPNNPDGRLADHDAVLALAAPTAKLGGQVVVDEAFADVSTDVSIVPRCGGGGLLVLRSFGKFFGLAGLRAGFAIGAPEVIGDIRAMLGPWSVSGPALEIATRAMLDKAWIANMRKALHAKRKRLETMIQSAGMTPVGATDLFVLASHPDSENIAKSLAKNHILVRPFSYDTSWIRFGLPADDVSFERLECALAEALR